MAMHFLTFSACLLFTTVGTQVHASNEVIDYTSTIYQFSANDSDGNIVSLSKYEGKVVIIVNVASYCGLTNSNYHQLKTLYDKYHEKGLEIAAFPCNQFANQEPDDARTVKEFLKKSFQFEPDVFEKIKVNGANEHPLYTYLKAKQPGTLIDHIKWNFTKFLVNRFGYAVQRYAPTTEPLAMEKEIHQLLHLRAEL